MGNATWLVIDFRRQDRLRRSDFGAPIRRGGLRADIPTG